MSGPSAAAKMGWGGGRATATIKHSVFKVC